MKVFFVLYLILVELSNFIEENEGSEVIWNYVR